MQSQHAGAIRGLGIATIALSAISLLACLFGLTILVVMGAAFSDPALVDELSYGLTGPYVYDYSYYGYGYHDEEFASFVGFSIILVGVFIVWEILTCIVSLIAGIVTLRSANDSSKLNKIFGWTLAGAIASLLGGRFITMVVLIVAAVFATKDRGAQQNAYWQAHGSPVTVKSEGAVQEASAQPVQPPVQPAAASVQPVSAQPVAASVQPQSTSAYQQAYQQAYGAQPLVAQPQPAQQQPAEQPQPAQAQPQIAEQLQPAEEPVQAEQPADDKQ